MCEVEIGQKQSEITEPPKRSHVTFVPLSPESSLTPLPRTQSHDSEISVEEFEFASLKESLKYLRTPAVEEGWNFAAFLWIIVGLVILFVLIWWVADRLLRLEIEELIKKPQRPSFAV
jgi:hypothetical protein